MVHAFLAASYWASRRPRHVIEKSIANSRGYGVSRGARQLGFARVVSDFATFACLAALFVAAGERGRGLSKWLVGVIVADPELAQSAGSC